MPHLVLFMHPSGCPRSSHFDEGEEVCFTRVIYPFAILLMFIFLRSDEFPGIPPDFDVVIFGPYLEPMFKTKSRHDDMLAQLENMLISGMS